MSYLLRHGAKEHGIKINSDGYVKIKDLQHLLILDFNSIKSICI